MIGFSDPNLLEWSLSPNGKKIAVVDGQGDLQVLSMDGERSIKLTGFFQNVRWSKNSQTLYFYRGPESYSKEEVDIIDLKSGKVTMLFQTTELEQKGVTGIFDVSPHEDKIIFWNSKEIWLVTLGSV